MLLSPEGVGVINEIEAIGDVEKFEVDAVDEITVVIGVVLVPLFELAVDVVVEDELIVVVGVVVATELVLNVVVGVEAVDELVLELNGDVVAVGDDDVVGFGVLLVVIGVVAVV